MKKIFYCIIAVILVINNLAFADDNTCKKGYADLVAPLIPAVVNITTSLKQSAQQSKRYPGFPPGSPFEEFNQFFERFGMVPPMDEDTEGTEEEKDLKPYSAGSGFIIDSSGLIVTNHHVVADAEKITITLQNDKKFDAKLIGSDSRTDLALLKVDIKEKLPFVKFGDSDVVRVGDQILAIGNPFGLGGTVTSGIVSARSRDISTGTTSIVDNFIQTDAAINKGNSGGPMFNMNGEVIGINTAIYSPSGGNVGIGFAVPSSIAKSIIEQIRKNGKIVRGWLGVTIQSTEGIAEGLGIKDNKGALVVAVAKNSPAEKYGISVGDIILSFDGKEIINSQKLPKVVAESQVGKMVKVILLSKGKKKEISVKLGEFIESAEKNSAVKTDSEKQVIQGLVVSELTADLRSKFRINNNIRGVIITEIKKKTLAARSGVKIGDVIIAINQQAIESSKDLISILDEAKKQKLNSVMMWINRSGVDIFMQLPIK